VAYLGQPGRWTCEEFGELMGLALHDPQYVGVVDPLVETFIGTDAVPAALDLIPKNDKEKQQQFLRSIALIIAKVFALQQDTWSFPKQGICFQEVGYVIPNYCKKKFTWFTEDLYTDFVSEFVAQMAVFTQQHLKSRWVSSNFLQNALLGVSENWPEEKIDIVAQLIEQKIGNRDSFFHYLLSIFAPPFKPKQLQKDKKESLAAKKRAIELHGTIDKNRKVIAGSEDKSKNLSGDDKSKNLFGNKPGS